jgi:DNA-binding NarL/FixJ family response regulator
MPTNLSTSGHNSQADVRAREPEQAPAKKKLEYSSRNPSIPMQEPRTVVVLDRRALIRGLFARCLKSSNDNCMVNEFTCVAELQQAGPLYPPPAVIILCAQGRDEAAVERDLAPLSEIAIGTPVVVISETEDVAHVLAALNSGARGYIPTSVTLDVAKEALRLVEAGGTFVPASCLISSHQAGGATAAQRVLPGVRLTPRQTAVLKVLRLGKANKQIAYELNMREGTVKAHVRDIMRRLNVRNRTEVAILASHRHFNADDR